MKSNTPILQAESLKKTYSGPQSVEIIKGIDFELQRGESVAVVGKSGEGKTTFLHLLGTIDTQTSGTLSICGNKVSQSNQDTLRNKHIGFIFQAFHLLQDATVLENLLIACQIARKPTGKHSQSYKKAFELLELVGLLHRVDFSVNKLSGGEKQRVAIARALMMDPDIILADEPTGNLDHKTALEIQNLLLSTVKQAGKSLVLVTHNLELAKLLDKTFVLESGILRPYL